MLPYRDLFIALHTQGIRYLVAGGFAVNFHGVQRFTADLDLILHLETSNILAFDHLMLQSGYRPRLPVSGTDFANAKTRQDWIETKNMLVFSYVNPHNAFEIIDIFVDEPSPFEELAERKKIVSAFGIDIPVVGRADLIAMKKQAGRDKDLFDVHQLENLENERQT